MKRTPFLLWLTFFILSFSICHADGYRITVKGDSIESHATLELLAWDKKVRIDSVASNKKGIFLFKGRKALSPGEYSVKYPGGSFEFFISELGEVKESFTIKEKSLVHKKGTSENERFTRFQNFLERGWRSLSSAERMQRIVDSLCLKAAEELPGSLLTRFMEMSSSYADLYSLVADGRVANTRFGRSHILQYLRNLEYNQADRAITLVDSLVCSSAEELKPLVAEAAFDIFYNSHIMGHESVTCHIAQEWFLNGKLPVSNEEKFYAMRTYVMFTNSSLVGKKAPELELQESSGRKVSLNEFIGSGDYTILYFYTDDCVNCKIETPKIIEVIDNYQKGILNFYSVYTGQRRERWKSYVEEHFFSYNPFVNWANVWDPNVESSYHLLYGVVSTPKLFLIDRHGAIVGRELDAQALKRLLDNFGKERDELRRLFDNCFAVSSPTEEFVCRNIDTLCTKTKRSGKLYKRVADELYLYLANSEEYQVQQGSVYLVENYILPDSLLWNDSRYIMRLKEAVKAFKMNRMGEVAENLELSDEGGSSVALWDIKSNYKVLYFYKPGCAICNESTKRLKELWLEYGERLDCAFIAVNTAQRKEEWLRYIIENELEWINLWDDTKSNVIFARYFLKEVPQIYLLDRNNVVVGKNLTPSDVEELLEIMEKRGTD